MDYGCSALTVRTQEGGVLMGRNFDFNSATGIVLHTVPEQGYETYTLCTLHSPAGGVTLIPLTSCEEAQCMLS